MPFIPRQSLFFLRPIRSSKNFVKKCFGFAYGWARRTILFVVKVSICTQGPVAHWARAVIDGFRRHGHKATLCAKPNARHFDAGWVRIVPGTKTKPKDSGYWLAAKELEERGVPLINSLRSHVIAADKMKSQEAFLEAGLSPPPAWGMNEWLPPEIYPVICKPISGSRGDGIALVGSKEEAERHESIEGRDCMLQEFVPSARCLRVICSQDRVVRVYEKRVEPGEIVASVARGAERIARVHPSPEVERMAMKMVRAVGGGLMGVDILEDAEGNLWPLEINSSFAFDPEDDVVISAFVDKAEEICLQKN